MYASFEYYHSEYGGTAITSADSYKYYGNLAAQYIEQATFGRATAKNEKVRSCECRVAEILASNHENLVEGEREVKSESVGGWSRTFAENKRSDEALAGKITEAIHLYLGRTGLLSCVLR